MASHRLSGRSECRWHPDFLAAQYTGDGRMTRVARRRALAPALALAALALALALAALAAAVAALAGQA